ncbi:MAG: hypothetical protein LUQ65_07695 [Candidatus Helarchaeota archaeon]|nr:hypothetical protein [Candidatus Helarchaeota archaeon]
MQKISRKVLYSVTFLGMLLMLTIGGGLLGRSTPQSIQNQVACPTTLSATADNNALRWNVTWGGVSSELGMGVAMDANGSAYCIGYSDSFGAGGYDFALVKVASNGTRLWNITWGGTGNDRGFGVAVDASGSAYCVGWTASFGAGATDFALVKVAPNGTRLWNFTWGSIYTDVCNGVAVDASGSVYCVGQTYSAGGISEELALVKVASNGTRLWNITWGGAGQENGQGVAVDANGSAYCVGWTNSFGAGNADFALVKVAPNGTRLWNTTWGDTGSEYSNGVTVDASGSIYCVGWTDSYGAGGYDFALVKVAPNGTGLWNTTWGGVSADYGTGVAMVASGAVYCGGYTQNFGAGNADFALVKVAPNGIRLWNTTWGGTGNDYSYGVTVTNGSAYCAGNTYSFGAGSTDFALVKLIIPPEAPVLNPISPASDKDGIVTLNWSDVAGVEKYCIYRELFNITSIVGLQPKYVVIESQYIDSLTIETTYYYVIVAAVGPFNSTISNCESVTFATSSGVPGFELVYLLIGLLALLPIVQQKRSIEFFHA